MPIIKKKEWNKWVKSNKDSYGKCCVDIARQVMKILDQDKRPIVNGYADDTFNCHNIICKAEHDIGEEGITGFMAGAIALMVSVCHSRGEEFRRSWNCTQQIKDEGDRANASGGILNPALLSISKR